MVLLRVENGSVEGLRVEMEQCRCHGRRNRLLGTDAKGSSL